MKKNKKLIIGTLILSLFGVFVGAMSTLAWFQIDSAPATPTMVSSDPSIEIDNEHVTGYKSNTGYNSVGMQDYNQSIINIDSGSGVTDKTNENQGSADLSFDVPKDGYGYYFVKKNPSGSFNFFYNTVQYYTKLTSYRSDSADGAVTETYIEDLEVTAGEQYEVIHYWVNTSNRKTKFDTVSITNRYPDGASAVCSISSNVITILAGKTGHYRIWVDHAQDRKVISFEAIGDTLADLNNVDSGRVKSRLNTRDYTIEGDGSQEPFTVYFIWNKHSDGGWNVKPHISYEYYDPSDKEDKWVGLTAMTTDNWDWDYGTASYNLPKYTKVVIFAHSGNGSNWDGQTANLSVYYNTTYNRVYNCYSITTKANGNFVDSTTGWSVLNNVNNVIVYNSNGGSGSMSNQTIWPNNSTLTSNSFVRRDGSGYTTHLFDGWNTAADGSGTSYTDGQTLGYTNFPSLVTGTSVTLYAQWRSVAISEETFTTYLYDMSGDSNWATVYAKGFNNSETVYPPSTVYSPTTTTTHEGYKLYKFDISVSYPSFDFYNSQGESGTNQTIDLTQSAGSGKYFVMDSSTSGGKRTGTWYSSLMTASYYTVYLYDDLNPAASSQWTSAKVHAWNSSGTTGPLSFEYSIYATHTHDVIQSDGTTITYNYYEFHISNTYSNFLFYKGSISNNNKTGDLTKAAGSGKYYVLSNLSNNVFPGIWYSSLASETSCTYYFFDNRTSGRWTAPKAHAWITTDGTTQDTSVFPNYPNINGGWPGVSMIQLTSREADDLDVSQSYAWKITISETYDKIIFNNGGSGDNDQTVSLDTATHNGQIAAITTKSTKWNAEWIETVKDVKYKAVYFMDGKRLSFEDTGDNTYVDSDVTPMFTRFSPTKRSFLGTNKSTRDVRDDTNGVYYHFDLTVSSGDAVIYTNLNCTSTLADGDDITDYVTDDVATLYLKYTTSSSNYTTFFVDTWAADTGSGANKWGSVTACGTDGTTWVNGIKVASDLYKLTLPTLWDFRVSNGLNDVGGNNFSTSVDVDQEQNPRPTSGLPLLHIKSTTTGNNHDWTWARADLEGASSRGTALIEISSDGLDWDPLQEMEVGDLSTNYYVYEHGVQIAVNKYIRVVVSGSGAHSSITSNYTNGELVFNYGRYFHDGTTNYVASTTVGGTALIQMKNYTGTARFNFYISDVNGTAKVTIAMMPDLGNGYYIMPYNSTNGMAGYFGEVKMESLTGDIVARYSNYYATADSQIVIKSYIDLEETVYSALASGSSDFVYTHSTKNAVPENVLEFKTTGNYDISISSSGYIIVAQTTSSGNFTLNPLDLTNKANSSAIWGQKTSLVIEVPFYCTNTYTSEISLTVINPLSGFIGVALYCSETQLGSSAYATVRGSGSPSATYNALSSASVISDSNTSFKIDPGDTNKYYAYILIDYLPDNYSGGVNYSNFNNSAYQIKNISFYLSGDQKLS